MYQLRKQQPILLFKMTIDEFGAINQIPDDTELKYVSCEEYWELALSNRMLVRFDQRNLGLRGMLDSELGICYVIPEGELFNPEPKLTTVCQESPSLA